MSLSTVFPALTGDPVFFRTYSRFTAQGREQWSDAVQRMIAGLVALGNLDPAQVALMTKYAMTLKAIPSGRWAWVGGTEWLEQPENFSGGYNCSSFNLTSFNRMAFMMSLSMMGVGTGTVLEQKYISQLPQITAFTNLSIVGKPGDLDPIEHTTIEHRAATSEVGRAVIISVGDSREGWCRAYELLLELSATVEHFSNDVLIQLGHIRASGAKIKGFGGVTNPIGLERMFTSIARILNKAVGRQLTSVEVCLILDEVALAVVAGNIRRCIIGGERVSTISGEKAIQDIVVGDRVLTSSGEYKTVTDTFDQGIQATLKIKTQDFELSVTPNHRLAIIKGNTYEWIEAGDLHVGDSLVSTLQYLGRDGVGFSLELFIPEELTETNLVPCPITSIEPGETAQTYDIEVADLHEFIVNGLLSHNSANMRQFDANDEAAAAAKDNMYKLHPDGTYSIDPDKDAHRMGNHTLVFHQKPTLERCIQAVTKQYHFGEGAIMWAGESVARSNADLLDTPGKKQIFLDEYSVSIEAARAYLEHCSGGLLPVDELDHRMARYGVNPCAAAGTMVLTRQGHFPIEDLVGETVEIWDGDGWVVIDNFRVTGTDQPVFSVRLQDGTELDVTDYHSFVLADGSRKMTKELLVGDELLTHDVLISSTHIESAAYLKGFLVGDGTNANGYARLDLYAPKAMCKDRLLKSASELEVKQLVAAGDGRFASKDWGFAPEHNNREMMQGLANVDLISWSTRAKVSLPADILNWSLESKCEFIAGVMDADGCALDAATGFAYHITSIHQQWIIDFQLLLKSIGINSKQSPVRRGGVKDFGEKRGGKYVVKDTYRLSIAQAGSIKLSNLCSFSRLKSFKDRIVKIKQKSQWSKVESVEFSHMAEKVYCCTVPTNSQFALSNNTIVMNCGEITGNNFMCVAPDTMLITKDGLHEIQSLADREVEVWNGVRWSKVTPIKTGSDRKLVRVSFNDGSYLDTTENHRFLVADRFQSEYQTVEAKDLDLHNRQYQIHTPPVKIMYEDGMEVDLSEAYTLGVITGDGSVDKNSQLQLVLFGEKQPLSIKGKKSAEKQRKGYAVTCVEVSDLKWVDKSLVYALKHTAVGLETIATWSRSSILAYLAGLADTDGSNTHSGGIRIYISGYKRAHVIQLLLTKCGIKSSVIKIHPKGQVTNFGTRAEDLYAVSITETAEIPCQRLDTSKSHTPPKRGKYQVVTGVTELEGSHDTYCFNEPEFHNAVFGNSLTKNCNLYEIHLNQLDPHNTVEQLEAFEAAALGVSALLHHEFMDEMQRYSRKLDPIVGVSFTGLFDFFVAAFGIDWLRWWQAGRPDEFGLSCEGYDMCRAVAETLGVTIADAWKESTSEGAIYRQLENTYLSRWRERVEQVVATYCSKNNLKTPNRSTTVQPAGCLDKTAIRIFDQGLLYADEIIPAGSGETIGLDLSVRGGVAINTAIANQPLNLVKVTLRNGRQLRMTQNHRMSVGGEWIEAVNLEAGMVIDHHIGAYQKLEDFALIGVDESLYTREAQRQGSGSNRGVLARSITTPTTLCPDLGYFLGAMLGNGCFSPEQYRIRFSHGNIKVLERLNLISQKLFGVKGTLIEDHRCGAFELSLSSKQLFNWFHQNNLAKTCKSKDLDRIPEPIRRSSLETLLSFFCGLVDTDGCIRQSGGLSIESASENFVRNLQQVAESIGLSFGISHNTKGSNYQAQKSIWSLTLSRTKSESSAVNYLNRHSAKAQIRPIVLKESVGARELYRIASVEPELVADYSFDFAVEGVDDNDSWYWQGALKSHNTKSLLTGASPGWHPPKASHFIRRMTFRREDPVALACIEMGYNVIPSQTDKDENNQLLEDAFDPRCTEWLVEMPIATNWAGLEGVEDISPYLFSATAQFDFYMGVQEHYTRHNTSATIELQQEEIEPLAKKIFEAVQTDAGYISAALLARFDAASSTFPRLPFEPISKAKYEQLIAEVEARSSGKTFAESFLQHDIGLATAEVGPSGCDGDKCLMPERKP